MKQFKVVDLRDTKIVADKTVEAATPEQAVLLTLGVDAVRGSSKRIPPIARVYWQDTAQQTNMVRLYARIGERKASSTSPNPMQNLR
ncbi:MAG: hypothetical protein EON56_00150 [Alphaproteobacteria bacterium]|nr:MAG: hypothetical protein EON56_00150 [Alphaproteobacteria bacterium]